MFENMSMIHAISTALISYGGFPEPPRWYKNLTNTIIGKIIALTILIFQSGGRLNLLFSLIVAITFYLATEAMKRINVYIRDQNEDYKNMTDKLYEKFMSESPLM
jgi:hypothetical protein